MQEGDELLVITQQGMILRMQTNDVRAIGRATQGVRLIDIEGDDQVVSIARLVEKEEEDRTASRARCPGRASRVTVANRVATEARRHSMKRTFRAFVFFAPDRRGASRRAPAAQASMRCSTSSSRRRVSAT